MKPQGRRRATKWVILVVVVLLVGAGGTLAWFKTRLPIIIKCGFPPTIEGKRSRWVLSSDGVLAMPCPVGWKQTTVETGLPPPTGVFPASARGMSDVTLVAPDRPLGRIALSATAYPVAGSAYEGKTIEEIASGTRAFFAQPNEFSEVMSIANESWTRVGPYKAWVVELRLDEALDGESQRIYYFIARGKFCGVCGSLTGPGGQPRVEGFDDVAKHVRVLK